MIHPHTEVRFITEETGYGVVATRLIPEGTLTWVKDRLDREFSREDVEKFDPPHREILDRYSYRNARGHYAFCWDHSRFMNHSFRPTCLLTPYNAEIAIRDIHPGEELTNDYGLFNIIESFTPGDEGTERKQVHPDDLLRYHAEWDTRIAGAMKHLHHVEQPLSRLISPDRWNEILAMASGETAPRSVAELFYSDVAESVEFRDPNSGEFSHESHGPTHFS